MSLLLQRIIFRISDAAKNWTIIKNKYLVPVKPKRLPSAYFLFAKEKRSSHQGTVVEVAKKLGAQWKTLPQDQKKKYQDEVDKLKVQHQAQLKEYEDKYVTPFKTISAHNIAVKKFYQNTTEKPKSISEGASLLVKATKKLSAAQKQVNQEEALKIKSERALIQANFEIPEAEFKSQKYFIDKLLRERNLSTFSQLPADQQEKLVEEYKAYVQNFNKKLEEFAKKHNLTLTDLQDIIKTNKRKLKKEDASETSVEQLSGPQKPKALPKIRTVAGRRTSFRAKPVRKPVDPNAPKKKRKTAKKTAVKKTAAKQTAAKKRVTKTASSK